jgi:hypothetical protein
LFVYSYPNPSVTFGFNFSVQVGGNGCVGNATGYASGVAAVQKVGRTFVRLSPGGKWPFAARTIVRLDSGLQFVADESSCSFDMSREKSSNVLLVATLTAGSVGLFLCVCGCCVVTRCRRARRSSYEAIDDASTATIVTVTKATPSIAAQEVDEKKK